MKIQFAIWVDSQGNWAVAGDSAATEHSLDDLFSEWNLDEVFKYDRRYRVTMEVPIPHEQEWIELNLTGRVIDE